MHENKGAKVLDICSRIHKFLLVHNILYHDHWSKLTYMWNEKNKRSF